MQSPGLDHAHLIPASQPIVDFPRPNRSADKQLFHVEQRANPHLRLSANEKTLVTASTLPRAYNSSQLSDPQLGIHEREGTMATQTKPAELGPPNAFMGILALPTEAQIAAALGSAIDIWNQLISWSSEQGANEQEWKSSSPAYGWSLRLKKKKRTILYLSPCQSCFRVALILGDKAVAAARRASLPKAILTKIDEATRYAEGTGIRILVRNLKDLAAIEKLALIKLAS